MLAGGASLLAFSLEAILRKRWTAAVWWAVPLVFVLINLVVDIIYGLVDPRVRTA